MNRLLVAAAASLWVAPAAAQETLNRVGDGNFESGVIGLSVPETSHFPLFAGGWASRGRRVPEISYSAPFEGRAALRLSSTPTDSLSIIQDIPLDSSAFGMRFAFSIESGEQAVRLVDSWDRGSGDGDIALIARISSAGIELATPDGHWQVTTFIAPGTWHTLTVISDPRRGTHNVRLNDELLMALPATTALHPSTFIAGGGDGIFRYDAIEVMSLIELELGAISNAVRRLDIAAQDEILDRLSAAQMALARGSRILMLPELGVARNMLGAATPGTQDLRRALSDLIELIEAAGNNRAGRPVSWS